MIFARKVKHLALTIASVGLLFGVSACASPDENAWLGDVPPSEFDIALQYLQSRMYDFENQEVVTVIDYSKHSSEPRMFVIDLVNRTVEKYHVAHGAGSDPNHDGYLDAFGNGVGSRMSPSGFFKVAEQYSGQHGQSLRLDGLQPHNANARERAIVIHGAKYVFEANRQKMGRSWGCPAVADVHMARLYSLLPGSLLYIIDDLPVIEDDQQVASLNKPSDS